MYAGFLSVSHSILVDYPKRPAGKQMKNNFTKDAIYQFGLFFFKRHQFDGAAPASRLEGVGVRQQTVPPLCQTYLNSKGRGGGGWGGRHFGENKINRRVNVSGSAEA